MRCYGRGSFRLDWLGENVRYYRELRGLTQEELGKRVGLSQPRVSEIEAGATIDEALREKLAAALRVEPRRLSHDDPPSDLAEVLAELED